MDHLESRPATMVGEGALAETVAYEEANVQDLALSPEAFKGRRVSVSGKVASIEEGRSGHLVHLEVPVRDGFPGETQAVAAEYGGDVSSLAPGQLVTAKGACDDIHVIVVPNRCGIIAVPLLRAESLEPAKSR